MKIIQIASHFPPHTGGLQKVAIELSERLARKGHQVEVLTSDIGCSKEKQLKSTKNLKINYLPAWEFAHTPIIPSLFSRLMKISQDSIIHVHVAQALVPEIVWLVSKIKGIPYIAHIHGDADPCGKLGFLLPLYKRFLMKRTLNGANRVICLSEEYKNLISKKYDIRKEKIVIIPNGVNESFFIKEKKFSQKLKKIIYVGRLSKEKNLDKIIKAIPFLKSRIIFDVVGEGEKRKEIENLIQEKKLKNVILHGRKEGKDLINFYKSAEIFILVSNKEGLPLTLLEAMATRTPIIASDVQGISSVIKNNYNGILIEPNPKKIAEAIEKLIKNPKLREKLAKNGLKEVKKYSWDKVVKQTEDVYKEILDEHNKKLKEIEMKKEERKK